MTKKPTKALVDQLLNRTPAMPQQRNMVNENKPLAEAIKYFLELKIAADEHVKHITLAWFYREMLQDRFSGPKNYDTIKNYVRKFLKVDPRTGRAL